MQVWKPLLLIVPAGLVLGIVGAQYANPVIRQRGAGESWLDVFESRAQRYGAPPQAEAPPEQPTPYVGGSRYAPRFDDRAVVGWQGPDFSGWPEYTPAPMPTIAELEAEVARRDAALDRRAAAAAPEDDSGQLAAAAADAAQVAADDPRAGDEVADDAGAGRGAADRVAESGSDATGHPKIVTFGPMASAAPGPAPEPRSVNGNLPATW